MSIADQQRQSFWKYLASISGWCLFAFIRAPVEDRKIIVDAILDAIIGVWDAVHPILQKHGDPNHLPKNHPSYSSPSLDSPPDAGR